MQLIYKAVPFLALRRRLSLRSGEADRGQGGGAGAAAGRRRGRWWRGLGGWWRCVLHGPRGKHGLYYYLSIPKHDGPDHLGLCKNMDQKHGPSSELTAQITSGVGCTQAGSSRTRRAGAVPGPRQGRCTASRWRPNHRRVHALPRPARCCILRLGGSCADS